MNSPIQPASAGKPKQLMRRVGVAACAGMLTCVAICALPALLTALIGAGAAAGVAHALGPGSELLFGGAAFVIAFVVSAWISRSRGKCQQEATACCGGASVEEAA